MTKPRTSVSKYILYRRSDSSVAYWVSYGVPLPFEHKGKWDFEPFSAGFVHGRRWSVNRFNLEFLQNEIKIRPELSDCEIREIKETTVLGKVVK